VPLTVTVLPLRVALRFLGDEERDRVAVEFEDERPAPEPHPTKNSEVKASTPNGLN
jgi:SHS2 domain-containing protein